MNRSKYCIKLAEAKIFTTYPGIEKKRDNFLSTHISTKNKRKIEKYKENKPIFLFNPSGKFAPILPVSQAVIKAVGKRIF